MPRPAESRSAQSRRAFLRTGFALFALAPLAACSGQVSQASPTNPSGRPLVYPITAEQADGIIAQAMVEVFPGSPVSAVSLPYKGYTVTLRILLDTHQITAYAVPAGVPPEGYSFQVDHAGTIPLTGGRRAADLFAAITRRAATLAAPLPAS